jgi:hypothetical protein
MSNRALGDSIYISDYEMISLTASITYAWSNFSALLLIFSAQPELEASRKTYDSNILTQIITYWRNIHDVRQLRWMFLQLPI